MDPLLLQGRLVPVVDVAEDIGFSVHPKTALRWCLRGRGGHRLPSIKIQGQRVTTKAALLTWLASTSLPRGAETPAPSGLDIVAADAVLAAFGLPRENAQEVRP